MNVTLPKNVKRHTSKKFTKKRRPYKSYLNAEWKWEDVFIEIDKIKDTKVNFLRIIADKYGIIYGTLKNKYNKMHNNTTNVNTENRGGSNKIFTKNDERELYNHIKINFIDKNTPLTNNIIKEIALDKFKQKNTVINSDFKKSNGWCSMFKKKWNLSTQKIKCSKKATNNPTDADIKIFLDKCNDKCKNIKKKFIFNYDETKCNIANPPKTAIRIKGKGSTKIYCKNNLKVGFTAGLTISASGAKLKPLVIAKGKTKRCLSKFKLNDDVIGTYTQKGWINENCMIQVLDQIASITNGEKSVLFMDQYESHKTEKIKEYATIKNIDIVYIPVGMTYKYQPLDTTINGILKGKMTETYSKFIAINPDIIYSHEQCVIDFVVNFKKIKKGTIMRSFNCLKRSKSDNI